MARKSSAACIRSALGGITLLFAALLQGCGGSGGGDTGGSGGATSGATAAAGPSVMASAGSGASTGTTAPGSCDADPLRTGLTAQQTGVSVDAFDCQILTSTEKYAEPDAMIFKAIIYVESRFATDSVACPNLPCGTPAGWTSAESGCYGLMQIVPACGGDANSVALLANGHPDLTTDPTSPDWGDSVFNPAVNIDIGVAGVAYNRTQMKMQFSGCTEEQYTLMAVGTYNSYGSTKSCTEYNTDYDDAMLMAYQQYAAAAGYTPHPY